MAQRLEFRLHVRGPESSQDFVLPLGKAILGRDPSCELVLSFPLVSRRHAQFVCTKTTCEVTDLGSANGTSVDGVKLTPQVPASLADGSLITIGPFEIQVETVAVEGAMGAQPLSVVEMPVVKEPEEGAVKKAARAAVEKGKEGEVPPSPPAPPQGPPESGMPEGLPYPGAPFPPGLGLHSIHLLNYLPGIYHTDFMSRFLALFESLLIPIEWNIDNFDLYLDPGTTPVSFLPWLANWYTIIFDSTWREAQRRTLLKEAYQIYARRGTRWALSRVLEIYLGKKPEITEFTLEKEPFTFIVSLPMSKADVNQELIEAIIDASKPAHTTYRLTFE